MFTRWLARGTNMPKLNSPNKGPPMTPKIVNDACKSPPQNCATEIIEWIQLNRLFL